MREHPCHELVKQQTRDATTVTALPWRTIGLANRDTNWTMMRATTTSMNNSFAKAAIGSVRANPYECFAET